MATVWNKTIKLRDANMDTPIEKHCNLLLAQMNTASGAKMHHEVLAFIESVENGTYEPPQYVLNLH